jgi:hypothetical protein
VLSVPSAAPTYAVTECKVKNQGRHGRLVHCFKCGTPRSQRSLNMAAAKAEIRTLQAAGATAEQIKAARRKHKQQLASTKEGKKRFNRSDKGKAMKKRAFEKYCSTTAGKQNRKRKQDEYNGARRQAYLELRSQLADENGLCRECHAKPPDDIDHMRPELKKESPSNCTPNMLREEVARNTVDGIRYLQSLCRWCHDKKTHLSRDPNRETKNRIHAPQRARILRVNQWKRSVK